MRGVPPKDPEQRQRRNKPSTAAVLTIDIDGVKVRVPALTQDILGSRVHASTRRWWLKIWHSPMAPRWLEADVEGLYLTAILHNEFYIKPSAALAAEIRQQEARFGLSPIDRRRLDWRIEGARPAPAVEPAAPTLEAPSEDFDPRRVLRALK